jgi:hypothetical protein
MARIVKSNGEDKLALSKNDLTATFNTIEEELAAYDKKHSQTLTASGSFSVKYQSVINHCQDVFYRQHGIRISRTQALDHILHSWSLRNKVESY